MNDGPVPAFDVSVAPVVLGVVSAGLQPEPTHTKTMSLKVRAEAWAWLDQAAREVNLVWNYCNATSHQAIRSFAGPARFLSAYEMDKLTAGAGACFDRIGSDVCQRVSSEYVTRRKQFKKAKLRFRASGGSKKALGWIPFKAVNIKFREQLAVGVVPPAKPKKPLAPKARRGESAENLAQRFAQYEHDVVQHPAKLDAWTTEVAALPKRRAICFMGKSFRLFDIDRLFAARASGSTLRSGSFSQNALGEWFVNIAVTEPSVHKPALQGPLSSIGIDPGCTQAMTTSDGAVLDSRFYRDAEEQIAGLQKRGHKKQAKRVHQKVKNQRSDARNKFARSMVDQYQYIFIGNASAPAMAKTHGKSVLDSAWGACRAVLHDRGHRAGRTVVTVSEYNTTRSCSCCGARVGPTGQDGLVVRHWTCGACGATHQRDENAGLNIEYVGWLNLSAQANATGVHLFPVSDAASRHGRPCAGTR